MLSPTLFESVFNSSTIGNALLSPTSEATILAVNDAFLKGTSRRREELIGVSLFEAFPENPNDPDDTGEEALRRSLARVLETHEPHILPAQRYPIPIVLPNAEVQYEERFWSAVDIPVFDDKRKIVCISHTTTDVTEQERAVAALRESEKRFRALTSAAADVVYRMNPDWTQLHQLQGHNFLKDAVEPLLSWIDEYIPPEHQELVRFGMHKAIHDKTMYEVEHRVRRADGTYGWALSRAVPMFDAAGNIYEWIGAASDITQRKEGEERLQDANRRKDDFLAMLAHELRNPLAPIGAAAQLLQLVKLDEDRVRSTSAVIGRQVKHMTGLIDDLLDVSRVTRGLINLDTVPLDIQYVINEAVEQVAPVIRSRQHALTIQLAPQSALVLGDKKRLVQVLVNVLNNAAKYTTEGGHLALRTLVKEEHVSIEVSDNGIGMTSETAKHAFELFIQAERSSDRSSGGLGLGLALVKSIVELHQGTVTCKSDGLGQGSTFSICLPRLLQPALRPEYQPSSEDIALPGVAAPLKILVVDDNVDAAEMLKLVLEAMGHDVKVAYGAHQALEQAMSYRPQVCLLDLGLPEIDGNEVARRLRARPENAGVVLLAVTGYGQESDRASTLAAGFNHHLVKPVDTVALTSILSAIKSN